MTAATTPPRPLGLSPGDPLAVLMPAARIPDGATVSKRTGEKRYILRDRIEMYGVAPDCLAKAGKNTLMAPPRAAFLVDASGNLSLIDGPTLLLWHISVAELHAALADLLEETPQ